MERGLARFRIGAELEGVQWSAWWSNHLGDLHETSFDVGDPVEPGLGIDGCAVLRLCSVRLGVLCGYAWCAVGLLSIRMAPVIRFGFQDQRSQEPTCLGLQPGRLGAIFSVHTVKFSGASRPAELDRPNAGDTTTRPFRSVRNVAQPSLASRLRADCRG
jgi:hypothetical protein